MSKTWADYDIDVAATLLDNSVVLGECKWWDSKVGANVLRDLRKDGQKTAYPKSAPATHHLLVSKSGFTDDLEEQARASERLHLVSAEELLRS